MELPVLTQTGTPATANVQVSEELFACPFNEGLVHQVVTAYMAAGRAGTKAQKTRSRSARRRYQTLETKRHWPGACWIYPQPIMAWRW